MLIILIIYEKRHSLNKIYFDLICFGKDNVDKLRIMLMIYDVLSHKAASIKTQNK